MPLTLHAHACSQADAASRAGCAQVALSFLLDLCTRDATACQGSLAGARKVEQACFPPNAAASPAPAAAGGSPAPGAGAPHSMQSTSACGRESLHKLQTGMRRCRLQAHLDCGMRTANKLFLNALAGPLLLWPAPQAQQRRLSRSTSVSWCPSSRPVGRRGPGPW